MTASKIFCCYRWQAQGAFVETSQSVNQVAQSVNFADRKTDKHKFPEDIEHSSTENTRDISRGTLTSEYKFRCSLLKTEIAKEVVYYGKEK